MQAISCGWEFIARTNVGCRVKDNVTVHGYTQVEERYLKLHLDYIRPEKVVSIGKTGRHHFSFVRKKDYFF